MPENVHDIVKERAFADVHPQHLGNLVQHDDHADARLETYKHRVRYEICNCA